MAPVVVAYVTDLIFQSMIAATARAAAATLRMAGTLQKLTEHLSDDAATTLLIDLNASGDPLAAIQTAKARPHPPRTICFVSHVQTDLIEAARKAGADEVLPRSVFVERLPDWFVATAVEESHD